MYAEFLRFYHYTAEEALHEYAKRFFALANSMYRLQAKEDLRSIATNGTDENVISQLEKQYKGNQGILQEVNVIRGISK